MRHILHLRPDIIKLDRSLIAGINDDIGQHALGAAMVAFARQIGATLIAEGIETAAELAAVNGLGMTAGQGYYLGRPTIQPEEWAKWSPGAGDRPMNGEAAAPASDPARSDHASLPVYRPYNQASPN
ncbi:EAL domain protein [compost metagenome]